MMKAGCAEGTAFRACCTEKTKFLSEVMNILYQDDSEVTLDDLKKRYVSAA